MPNGSESGHDASAVTAPPQEGNNGKGGAKDAQSAALGGTSWVQPSAAEWRENIFLEIVFNCTVVPMDKRGEDGWGGKKSSTGAPPLVKALASLPVQPSDLRYLGQVASELAAEGAPQRLTFELAEQVIFASVGAMLSSKSIGAIRWLAECLYRTTEDYYSNFRALAMIVQQLGPSVQEQLRILRELLVRHAALVITCPQVFGVEDFPQTLGVQSVGSLLFDASETACRCIFPKFVATLEEVDDDQRVVDNTPSDLMTATFGPIFDDLSEKLRGRTLLDPKTQYVKILSYLIQLKPLAKLCISRGSFFPPLPPQGRLSAGCGWTYQNESILGHILQPTTLDNPITKPGQPTVRGKYFPGHHHALSSQSLRTVRQDIDVSLETASAIMRSLCKVERVAVLRWIAAVLDANEGRSTLAAEVSVAAAALAFPGMEALTLKARGFCSTGFSLSLFWALLKLVEPIKIEKIPDVDPFVNLREDDDIAKQLLTRMFKESKMGDGDAVKKAKKVYRKSVESKTEVKFMTWVFWLTVKATKTLLLPSLAEFEHLVRRIQKLHAEIRAEGREREGHSALEAAYADYHCWIAILYHPNFMSAWWHFSQLALVFFLRNAYAFDSEGGENKQVKDFIDSKVANFPSTAPKGLALRNAYVAMVNEWLNPPNIVTPSPQFSSIPSSFSDTLMEGVMFYISSSYEEVFASVNVELLVASSIFILSNRPFVRNPHSRWSSGAKTLFVLQTNDSLKSRVEQSELTTRHLIPAVVDGYVDAQQAGFYGRIEQRLLYLRQLEKILPVENFKKRLGRYIAEQSDTFLKFVHSFVGNMSWVLEEAVSFLAEIKKRQTRMSRGTAGAAGGPAGQTGASGAAGADSMRESNTELGNEEGFETGHNVEEMAIEDVERTCKDLMDGGIRSVRVFALICEQTGKKITQSNLILPQVVTSLNCCLDHLVGPRCLELKVNNYEQYNFNPRELLAKLCECYVALSGISYQPATAGSVELDSQQTKRLLQEIVNEGRYFKPSIFRKAHDISVRENILQVGTIRTFGMLTRKLQEACAERQQQEDILANLEGDIPEEYLDPIMQELMEDPVCLKTSGKVMDRRHIERHLMDEEFDPFSRLPLKKEDLEPLPKLKKEIDEWLNEVITKRKQPEGQPEAKEAADGRDV